MAEREATVVEVAAKHAGKRLDAFLAAALPGLSRSRIKALILAGEVAIGGAAAAEPKRPVQPGERIALRIPEAAAPAPKAETIPLDIVYEDDELLVIDKPAGLVVHPAAGNQTGTLVNAIIAHCGASLSGIGGVARPGIVHRLDKDTSGLLVVAKTDRTHRGLSAQFADHGRSGPLQRGYLAIAWGAPDRHEGTIDAALGRDPRNREKMAIAKSGGREAVTHITVEERFGPRGRPVASLIECRLETGRTHQIRVHLAAIGHPILGDRIYGAGFATKAALLPEPARGLAEGMRRQALHAYLLGFEHPATGKLMRFERPPPADMANLIKALRAISAAAGV
ncbi:MAG TPA: RluA family pseudouridine synthase [Bauldia sp.]|nr:RluA family pseudouridine synthase [Bauldia sp.]